MSLKSAISREDAPLTPAQLGYFNARLQSKVHTEVLKLFLDLAGEGVITKAFIARRLRKKPEQITRWLGASGNLTLKTVSDLFLAMGYEANISYRSLQDLPLSNLQHPSLAQADYSVHTSTGKNSGNAVRIEGSDIMKDNGFEPTQRFKARTSEQSTINVLT